jgi:L-malate glycosyltransferase
MENKKINIMFVIIAVSFGGAERQLVELLKGIDRERYNPCLVCFNEFTGFIDDIERLNIPIFYAMRKWRWDPFVIWKLLRLIRKHHIDLIHTFMPLAGIYGAVAARLSGLPIVNSSIRDTLQPTTYKKLLLNPTIALSDVIIANSEAGRRVYEKLFPYKIRVVYNGIDLKRFEGLDDKGQKKSELNLGQYKYIVSMVARLVPVKNPMMLIKAAALVLKDEPSTAFLIIGGGSLKADLEDAVKQDGLASNVFFLGRRKDVEEILQITDVGVLTSNREGLPNAIIEMLASGIPVVATDCEGTREVLDDGQTGFIVKAGDEYGAAQQVVRLLRDETLRQTMGARGKEAVFEKFNLSKMVATIENIYCELLGLSQQGNQPRETEYRPDILHNDRSR